MTHKIDEPSSDIAAMRPYWEMVRAIMGGAPTMRAATTKYLPQFENENANDYKIRVENAAFTNIFSDVVEGLASKPFAKETTVNAAASDRIKDMAEDVDGEGSHLSVFASNVFFNAISNAVDWILVDYPKTGGNLTVEQERARSIRPYWVRVPVKDVIDVRSTRIGGAQVISHFRFHENVTERDGFAEVEKKRIRVMDRPLLESGSFGPATYAVYEQRYVHNKTKDWVLIEEGPISIGIIPVVPVVLGRREGGSWVMKPPLKDAAYLQIEHYQKQSGLKYASELTAFPMLTGNGVDPPDDGKGGVAPAPVGPKTVLYAPPNGEGQHGEWKFIEPGAQSLTFLAEQLKETAKELRELGRQPLTANSGNLTVITTAFAAQKGNSAVQAWALLLKDALENALRITAMWLGEDEEPSVEVHTDFAIEVDGGETFASVLELFAQDIISAEALMAEAKRRNILADNYDFEADGKLMLNLSDEEDRLAALTAA